MFVKAAEAGVCTAIYTLSRARLSDLCWRGGLLVPPRLSRRAIAPLPYRAGIRFAQMQLNVMTNTECNTASSDFTDSMWANEILPPALCSCMGETAEVQLPAGLCTLPTAPTHASLSSMSSHCG